MSNGDETVSRATNATIDRRVERLEIAQAETNRAIDRLTSEQKHQGDLFAARLSTIEAKSDSVGTKIDSLQTFITAKILEGAQQMADWKNMPVGRDIEASLDDLRDGREKFGIRMDKMEHRLAFYAGALAVLSVILSIAGPTIVRVILGP